MAAGRNFEEEPSWIIISLFLVFVVISITAENLFHYFEHKFHHRQGYREVLKKIKDELMLMGLISLLLVIAQNYLTSACIPVEFRVGVPQDKCNGPLYVGNSSSTTSSAASSTSSSMRMLLAAKDSTGCPEGQVTLMDSASIHHVHLMIFIIACTHIVYSLLLIKMSEYMIGKWTEWEHWGDDPGETVDRLRRPAKYKFKLQRMFMSIIGQVWSPLVISPFKYLALRRFYVSKNDLPSNYNYAKHLVEGLEHDFHELVGISSWMWFIPMAQVLAEGYNFGDYNVFAFLSVLQTLAVGVFCERAIYDLTSKVFDTYSEHSQDSRVTQDMLDALQHEDQEKHREVMRHLSGNKPCCCCKSYEILKLSIRCVMFQNSTGLSQALFFIWQLGTDACYFEKRTMYIFIIKLTINVVMLVQNALVTVPLYSFVSHLDNHDNPRKVKRARTLHATALSRFHDSRGEDEHGKESSTKVVPFNSSSKQEE